jgi:hypothetical protein
MSNRSATLSRRELLQSALPAAAALAGLPRIAHGEQPERLPPVRAITRGPKRHWFGYYDKLQFDPTGRYALGMEVDFEGRSPNPDDAVKIGMVDLKDNDRWIELGESRAWCWQQGCMLQWRPGSPAEVLWNDRRGDRFVCHLLDVKTGRRRTVPHPVYTVSPDGRTAVAPDFSRLADLRPGYGYAGVPDRYADQLAPKELGIFHIDLETGKQELIIPVAEVAKIPLAEGAKVPRPQGDLANATHWFNHLLFSPDGSRFVFLHRWRKKGRQFYTRMITARPDGSDLRIVDPFGHTSHFIWRDPAHILAWSWHASYGDRFYLYEDKAGGKIEVVGKDAMTGNGHCSYLPGNQWILNDTYPDRQQRRQHVYLYHVASRRRAPLGHFLSPKEYEGEWRCDTHPRFSRDGRSVIIDSPHAGGGRQMYLIDISAMVGWRRDSKQSDGPQGLWRNPPCLQHDLYSTVFC